MNTTFKNRTVGELVTERPARAEVFEMHGIDYCCGGGKSLTEACAAADADPARVAGDLAAVDASGAGADLPAWDAMGLTTLSEHIVATHHAYLGTALPRIAGLLDKVANAHGAKHPETVELRSLFGGFAEELRQHMAKEEMVLFPMLREMEATGVVPVHCGGVQNPIGAMRMEHDDAGAALARIRELTGGFAVPEDACNTYRVMLHSLEALERDMHRHVHLENNILFPKAIEAQARAVAGA